MAVLSSFQQLPQHIRLDILRYLLVSERIREPPNHLLIEHYAFEVSILRVNRAINMEAMAIIYGENMFIKIKNDFVDAEKSMLNHEVPFFKLGRAFKHHVAEITITIDPLNIRMSPSMVAKKPGELVMVLSDVPKYTRLLRLLDFANFMGYQFRFKLHQSHLADSLIPAAVQQEVLAPFAQVRGCAIVQDVKFIGPFDQTVMQQVKVAMTQKIAWLRAGAWEIHDIALSIKRVGDWAFTLKNLDMALAKYEDTREFLKGALTLNTMMRGLDSTCEKAICGIECTTWVDTALLTLSDAALKHVGKRIYAAIPNMITHLNLAERSAALNEPIVGPTVIARFYHLLGVAELGLGHPIKSAKAFAKAYKLVTESSTKEGYEVAKSWSTLTIKAQAIRLNKMIAKLPKEPLIVPEMKEYCTPEVDSEHWVMRKLGLQGPIPYEDRIKGSVTLVATFQSGHQDQGLGVATIGEVKPEILQKHVAKYRRSIDMPIAKGRLTGWIGLSTDDLVGKPKVGGSGCIPQ